MISDNNESPDVPVTLQHVSARWEYVQIEVSLAISAAPRDSRASAWSSIRQEPPLLQRSAPRRPESW